MCCPPRARARTRNPTEYTCYMEYRSRKGVHGTGPGPQVFLGEWACGRSTGRFHTLTVRSQACATASQTKVNELSLCGSGRLGSAWPGKLCVCACVCVRVGLHSSRTLTLGECQFPLWVHGNSLPSPFSEPL
ncbi:unnamed protein product [Tetraodon nigroviridis]|uniref:(spotted green pufferfish) hypothetical protein n=1 Tax=Tetraodon nigroviridis TaxID=99883 RepID=Q4SR63_TETNG|nr:unnamed protein product [Tetraodon nigroviridis]